MITEKEIYDALQEVMDPEIPKLSVVDLGVITGVEIKGDKSAKVTMTPTFAGCPAIDVMKNGIKDKMEEIGIEDAEVEVSYEKGWNSDMITEKGRKILKETGFAPPKKLDNELVQIEILKDAECPFCGSKDTTLENPFGPTLCRAIHYCNNCKQAFEQFKPV